MWTELKTPEDAAALLDLYGDFHDAILKEARYDSGCYVDLDLGMAFSEACHLRCIFQRQRLNPSTIEMIYIGLQSALFFGNELDAINSATLRLQSDGWTWSENCGSQSPQIRARRVFWRIKDDWLGKRERYSAATNQDLEYYEPLEATAGHGRRTRGETI